MDIRTDLDSLDDFITRLQTNMPINADNEWKELLKTIGRLTAEAKRLGLPNATSEYGRRLKNHLGSILGTVDDLGHSREQHLSWALGDMLALRSDSAFGPALDRLKQSPSGSVH